MTLYAPTLSARQIALVARAFAEHGQISLCKGKTLNECFTEEAGKLSFWFNKASGTTWTITEGE